ncbi:hypothetical protein [Streptomyces sp. NPDC003032]
MGTDGLADLWGQVEEWLADHVPSDFATPHAGLTDLEIARLEGGLGFSVHRDLRSFLALCGGSRFPESSLDPGAFFFGYALLDVNLTLAAAATSDTRQILLARSAATAGQR